MNDIVDGEKNGQMKKKKKSKKNELVREGRMFDKICLNVMVDGQKSGKYEQERNGGKSKGKLEQVTIFKQRI